ncbi:hypothetical protein T484DRAFT_1919310 [Baffinella frigidus]|nr:hypothetical protein T484DRAFT_1919310 [Cryptophyta sp. CCMP2293]
MRRALFLALLFATLPLGSPRAGSGATPPWRPRGVDPTGASAGARMAAAERLRVFATRADAPAGLVRSMASFAKEEMGREWRALDARVACGLPGRP